MAAHAQVSVENASTPGALVLGALAEGLDISAAERVFGVRQATITRWLVRAGAHAQRVRQRFFSQLEIPPVQ